MVQLFTYLYHPGAVCKSHDVPFLPKESRVRPLDHLKLTEQLHCINLACEFVSHLEKGKIWQLS